MLSEKVGLKFKKLLDTAAQNDRSLRPFHRFVENNLASINDHALRLVSSPFHVYDDPAGGATGMMVMMGDRIAKEIHTANTIQDNEQYEQVVVDGHVKYKVRDLQSMIQNRIRAYQNPEIVDQWCVLFLFVALEIASRDLNPDADEYPWIDAVFLRFMSLIPGSMQEPLRWSNAINVLRRGLFDFKVIPVPEIRDAEDQIDRNRRANRRNNTDARYGYASARRPAKPKSKTKTSLKPKAKPKAKSSTATTKRKRAT